MDKPQTLSVKNYIARKMAVDLAIPEKTITSVIDFQFSEVEEALKTVDSVEMVGIGRFFYRRNAVNKYIKLVENSIAKWKERPENNEKVQERIKTLEEILLKLKQRRDVKLLQGVGRVEK